MATAVLVVAAVVGTVMGAVGKIQESQVQSAATQYNAQVADMRAESTKVAGRAEEYSLKKEKARVLSRQTALYAKAGVLPYMGSPLEVMAESATQVELDIVANRYNVEVGVSRLQYEARYQRKMAGTYRRAGYIGAGATLLTGGATTVAYARGLSQRNED